VALDVGTSSSSADEGAVIGNADTRGLERRESEKYWGLGVSTLGRLKRYWISAELDVAEEDVEGRAKSEDEVGRIGRLLVPTPSIGLGCTSDIMFVRYQGNGRK
jgi:hypothetical protein